MDGNLISEKGLRREAEYEYNGQNRMTYSRVSNTVERYEYDAFGKPYAGDLESGMNLGYTGKPYDAVTGLYNYEYRDYKPEAARFTTVDPIRDGNNWFAYVNNDPVNWVDPWGLSASDRSAESRSLTQEEKVAYIQATGHAIDFDSISVIEGRSPTVKEVKDAAQIAGYNPSSYPSDKEIEAFVTLGPNEAISLPNGTIYTGSKNPGVDLIGHEINHQDTYQNGATVTRDGATTYLQTMGEVFSELVDERLNMPDPYNTPGTLEYQADQVMHAIQQQQNSNKTP
jgi:RHS repeat-associated protein